MELSNSPVPRYYMSDMQYSRLYALVYLDEQFRSMTLYGRMYSEFMESQIQEMLSWSDQQLLDRLIAGLGGEQAYLKFRHSIPDAGIFFERYLEHARAMVPSHSVRTAVEENQFWAATNSIIYILNLHAFVAKVRDEHDVKLVQHGLDQDGSAEMLRNLMLNMMFIKPVQLDPVPSVLDGYSFNTLEDIIANKGNRAITLPSNATCC